VLAQILRDGGRVSGAPVIAGVEDGVAGEEVGIRDVAAAYTYLPAPPQ